MGEDAMTQLERARALRERGDTADSYCLKLEAAGIEYRLEHTLRSATTEAGTAIDKRKTQVMISDPIGGADTAATFRTVT